MRMTAASEYWMPRGAFHRAHRRRDPVARHDEEQMTSPDLPAELKAALDARLQGLLAQRRGRTLGVDLQNLSRRRRLRRDPVRDRCAGLCAGADARDLCRGHREPERAAAKSAPTLRQNACSMSAPGRARRAGRRRKRFRRCKTSRCWMPTTRCANWRSTLSATAFACARPFTNAAKPATRWSRRKRPTSSWPAT